MNKRYCILELKYSFGDFTQILYPVVLFGERDTVLVDCGYPGSLRMLEEQLCLHNIAPESLTKLVLTHQDNDHMGAAAELREKYPRIQILSSAIEEPYLSGKKKNLRLQQAEAMQEGLPEGQKAWGEQVCDRYRALKPVPVDVTLGRGDRFDWAGGCEILETPGHTPGHISIRSLSNDFLVTGDAAVWEEGKLAIANPQFCLDRENADKSLAEIQRYGCREYICYHGEKYRKAPDSWEKISGIRDFLNPQKGSRR